MQGHFELIPACVGQEQDPPEHTAVPKIAHSRGRATRSSRRHIDFGEIAGVEGGAARALPIEDGRAGVAVRKGASIKLAAAAMRRLTLYQFTVYDQLRGCGYGCVL